MSPRAFSSVLAAMVLSHVGAWGQPFATEAPADSAENQLLLGIAIHALGGQWQSLDNAVAWGPMANLSATLDAEHPTWELALSWDVQHGAGAYFSRAIEAGFDRRHGKGQAASRWRGRWHWQPLPSIAFDAGRDTLHDGWGRRSLFRGGHAAPVPFAQWTLDGGGRLRYRHRIEALQEAQHLDCWVGETGDPRTWVPCAGPLRSGIDRMVVTHRLEVDFGRRLTGALWGAVVWNTNAGQRLFEPHYLLPLTSLRPTEYAQGSSDNALVGAEGKLVLGSVGSTHPRFLYGQFLLDELIVSELLQGTEWWGNKFGLLGGMTWGTRWGGMRAELAAVRPWTYSHYTSTAAYTNGMTPLAHPLGANFVEATVEGHWSNGTWAVAARMTASRRGDDPTGNRPTGSLPNIGDIERTADQYAWLNGTARDRWIAMIDLAREVRFGRSAVQGFTQLVWDVTRLDIPAAPLPPPQHSTALWLAFGLRSTGPFQGGDW